MASGTATMNAQTSANGCVNCTPCNLRVGVSKYKIGIKNKNCLAVERMAARPGNSIICVNILLVVMIPSVGRTKH